MKVSELWLREWVNPKLSAEDIKEKLTMAGLEVDALTPVAGAFDKVVVAKVLSTKQHPDADKLSLCDVECSPGEIVKIVCGASNVRAGLKVALATIGAKLPNDFVIKEAKLRGELSQGMLCSATELGLSDSSEGILELPEDAPIGMNFRDFMQLDDNVFDVDLTPNRADCFSVLGVARELSVLTDMPLSRPETPEISDTIETVMSVELQVPAACPKFVTRVVKGINKNAVTPLWMKERLRRAGLRCIHPAVDVTNYVMIELGQPMHAFDINKIEGALVVRNSRPDEALTLLNGQELNLDKPTLIVADAVKPLSLAGVMGGATSEVTDDTSDVLFECAYFDPIAIANIARHYRIHSDTSMRYERGVDYQLQKTAVMRASYLLKTIAGGEFGPIVETIDKSAMPKPNHINFNPDKVLKLTGVTVPSAKMQTIFQHLEMQVDASNPMWSITVPSHRFDISLDVDCVEEIVRVNGYHHLKGEKIATDVKIGSLSDVEMLSQQLSRYFEARGFNETISYSFIDPEFQALFSDNKETLQLVNPISAELSEMRMSLWPGLLASMLFNLNRQQTTLKLFECGVKFEKIDGKIIETPTLAVLMAGDAHPLSWNEKNRNLDFYDLKGEVEALLTHLKYKHICFEVSQHPALHPGQSATITSEGKLLGVMGVLHPKLTAMLDLEKEIILLELNLKALGKSPVCQYQAVSKFPQIRRDLSFLIRQDVTAAAVEASVKQAVKGNRLKQFSVFDVYLGEHIPEGFKSLAISMLLQDDSKTLVEDEINLLINAILKKLTYDFNIQLRE